MASQVIEKTRLWINTLAARSDDSASECRDQLRSAFWQMRDNVIPFITTIHKDVLGLTVHDVTHLDALWQTADIIAGEYFDLTPLEGFVFGAAVLLHDTAMSVAAYPGGLDELKDLKVWKDVEAQYGSGDEDKIRFIVLRELHAQQAEELATISFKKKGSEETLFLLDDAKLRDSLAHMIGKIAHSHHWDHRDLIENLNATAGGVPGFPNDWTVNELKVACLLRCADAAHIDSRRAPSYLYSISNIVGHSDDHWRFQNKLNQPAVESDKLVFNSGSDFSLSDSRSWWLCYDVLRMVDREIQGSSAILSECGVSKFAVSGVKGVGSPSLLARHVRVKGWTPISAEVRVSDPVHLARTLGGQNLYGDAPLPPIRELLQNAADAIKARRVVDDRDPLWGRIRILIEADGDVTRLHIDDQGVGMSERVLTGPLIDFGTSFWGSDLARHEFPGLMSGEPQTIGQFGIGFFAVFLLGGEVSVVSRRYDAGKADENVLVFDGLNRRPLIRKAVTGELPRDFSTRVTVVLDDRHASLFKDDCSSVKSRKDREFKIGKELRRLICSLDINVEYKNDITGASWRHSADWLNSDALDFLKEVTGMEADERLLEASRRVRTIFDSENRALGRAAYSFVVDKYSKPAPLISVGGFTSYGTSRHRSLLRSGIVEESIELPSMIGVVAGKTHDAVREVASLELDEAAVADWANIQASLIQSQSHLDTELISACYDLLKAEASVKNLPFAIVGGEFRNLDEIEEILQANSEIMISLTYRDYRDSIRIREFSEVDPFYTSKKIAQNLFVIESDERALMDPGRDRVKKIISSDRYVLSGDELAEVKRIFQISFLISLCEKFWNSFSIFIEKRDIRIPNVISSPKYGWVLVISSST